MFASSGEVPRLLLPAVTGSPPVDQLLARMIHERLLQLLMPDSSETGATRIPYPATRIVHLLSPVPPFPLVAHPHAFYSTDETRLSSGIASNGQPQCRSTCSLVLPRRASRKPCRPSVDMTMRSASIP
jgi:hypothetical protein